MMDHHHDIAKWNEEAMQTEKVRSLFESVPLSIAGGLVNAFVLVYLLKAVIDHQILIGWLLIMSCIQLARLMLTNSFFKKQSSRSVNTWYHYFLIGSVSTAIMWGVTPVIMFAEDSLPHQVYLAFAFAGMGAGGYSALGAMRVAVNSFLLIMFVPLILRFLYQGHEMGYSMALMASVCLIIVLALGNRHYIRTEENIRLRFRSQQQEEKLRLSEARFRELFERNRSVELIIDPQDGAIIDANRAAEEFYGYPRSTILEMKISDINTLSETEVKHEMELAREEKRSHFLFKHQLSDGTIRHVEVHSGPMSWDGRDLLYSIIHDVTNRLQAEEKLRKLSSALEQAGESVIITDKDGYIEYVNPAFTRITGYAASEVISKKPSFLKSGLQDALFYKDLWDTITSGQVWQKKLVDKHKDGNLFPATVSIAPIVNEMNEITHYVGIQQDMSEHEDLENKFRQAQKMEALGTLVGGIAHDFNNMLAGITGNLYLIKGDVANLPDVLRKVEIAEKLSFRAAKMISQLMVFARKGVVQMHPFGLINFVKEISKLSVASLPESIEFRVNLADEEFTIMGDTTQMHQIILNLVNNARDAVSGSEDPQIELSVTAFEADEQFLKQHSEFKTSKLVCLSVRDNGCGIADDDMDNIFEPFFTTKEVGSGTGLGLSMVYGAIENLGGAIGVSSTLGEGTTFTIYLPIMSEDKFDTESEMQVEFMMGQGETILICDDNEDVLLTLQQTLERLNYQVLSARRGQEAVELFRANQRDVGLVIMDVVMPKMSGLQAVELLKEIDPDVQVIFATGYDKGETSNTEMPDNQQCILNKPYNIKYLSQVLASLLQKE